MHRKFAFRVGFASLVIAVLLLPLVHSLSNEVVEMESIYKRNKHQIQKMTPQLMFEVTVHGFLLWASMGFLMPVGILVVKMSNREQCRRRLKVLFYFHVILQMLSVLLATAGAIMSVKNFENAFNNNHQRFGLGLYVIIWVQALIGFFRPKRGSKQRRMWYFLHWLTGTATTTLGIINIYTGLHAYRKKTLKTANLWTVLFTVEICLIAFLYLFQDKWDYMNKQGLVLGSTDAVNPKDLEHRTTIQDLLVQENKNDLLAQENKK